MEIRIAKAESEIIQCFPIMAELRPHLSLESFLPTVREMYDRNGYRLAYLEDGEVKAVAGYRISVWLHTGKYLEIEDLVTAADARSRGYGGLLFDWLARRAGEDGCNQLRLAGC